MVAYDSLFGKVELTKERYSHIVEFHPEIKKLKRCFKSVLKNPDFLKPSKSDPKVRIFYKKVAGSKFLAIVIKTNSRNFILTAYITKGLI